MANTYYDSQLTAEEIEEVLEAINGILTSANNGKVLAISNGKFEARSVQWNGGEPVLEPLSVTANGDYYPEAGVDGFDEVHVAVPSSSPTIQPLSVTQNGTYTAPSGVDGYSPVTVNVSGGGGDDWQSLKNYIESSGTQYIDTGYIASDSTELELVIALSSSLTQYAALFGARNGAYNTATKAILAYRENTTMTFYVGPGQVKGAITYTPYLNVKSKWLLSKTKCSVFDSYGVNFYGFPINGGSVDNVNTIYLLSFNQNGTDLGTSTHCAGKVYRFRIYEDGVLVHEFLPWQENGVACLKDTITGNIKYNVGTGDFVYGTDS